MSGVGQDREIREDGWDGTEWMGYNEMDGMDVMGCDGWDGVREHENMGQKRMGWKGMG